MKCQNKCENCKISIEKDKEKYINAKILCKECYEKEKFEAKEARNPQKIMWLDKWVDNNGKKKHSKREKKGK